MLAITGATGHTGRLFMKELAGSQYSGQIRYMVRSEQKANQLQSICPNAEMMVGNLKSQEDIRALLTGADTVVNIANIRYSPEIVRIGRECGVNRFILVHTTGIYSKYKSASQAYFKIEEALKPFMEECNITILRPTMIFGDLCDHNISKFIRFVDRYPVLPIVAGGSALIQPVNARDLARGILMAKTEEKTKGKAYDLSGERAITVRQLYRMIGTFLGREKPIVSLPMWLCAMGARMIKAVSFGRLDVVEKVLRMGEDRAYSHDAATADFGYHPEAFEIGLRREVEQYIALAKQQSA